MDALAVPTLDWNSEDLASSFQLFKQRCQLYFSVKNVRGDKQVDYILLFTGDEGIKTFNSWNLTEEERKDPTIVLNKFESHIQPTSNFRLQRFHLQKYKQEPTESVDNFLTRCKTQAFKCRFNPDELKERLLEQLILGTRLPELQKELLGKDETLTLEQAVITARIHEANIINMAQLQEVQTPQTSDIHAVHKKHPCIYCGTIHPKGKCPSYGYKCDKCGIRNHWPSMCRKSTTSRQYTGRGAYQTTDRGRPLHRRGRYGPFERRQVDTHTLEDVTDNFELLTFESIRSDQKDIRDEVYASIDIELDNMPQIAAKLKAKVDTGAQGNLLPIRIYRRMYPRKLDKGGYPKLGAISHSDTILKSYTGTVIKQYGILTIPCCYNGNHSQANFFVTDSDGPAVLGLPSSRDLKLVTLNCEITSEKKPASISTKQDLIDQYPDRFQGIGNFKQECHITIDTSVPPVVHAPRRCPINMKDEIKAELDEMVQTGVIERVTEPTDWVSSITYSRKSNGKLRICLDPKDLNQAIKRPHYKTPTLEEVTHKFAGAKVFSKLDARHGYWSIPLDEESSLLTTFNSPFGRYKFRRLPFGLNLSQDVFQQHMDRILEDCPGTVGLADDVGLIGKDRQEHDTNLEHLMQTARRNGLVFNPEKCDIATTRIKFFGLTFDADGVHPDSQKVKAIKDIPYPSDTKQLQEFLGVVTYMAPFIPQLSQMTAPLRELMKKEAIFTWTECHSTAFNKIKDTICQDATLTYFDPRRDSVVRVDASTKGLGAVLLQDEKPIAFASKSLTDTEQRYANIEREMLAVVFGCERFHTYLYGKTFLVQSDHKPLEMIHLKNLAAAPQRLQRMLLRIQPYDMKIEYRPGKEMLIADALSRAPSRGDASIDLDVRVDLVQFSDQKRRDLIEGTMTDPELQALKEVIIQGWPERQKQVATPLKPYWSFRDELTIADGIILKGDCVVIPKSRQQDILKKLHEAHQGIVKTKLRAKTCLFWCGMNSDIERMVSTCPICQTFQKTQQQEPLLQHEVPTRPWQNLATDLFYMDDKEYLIICDYYSKFPIIRQVKGTTGSQGVIELLKAVFSEHGVPDKLISDNGPHFSSFNFRDFTQKWNFDHVTSSPHHPQSNGFIERQIQTVKKLLQKSKLSNIDPNMAMMILRATPIDSNMPSPAELLNGRKMKTNLPITIANKTPYKEEIRQHLGKAQHQQKLYYDTRAGEENALLIPEQLVRYQNTKTKTWSPATIAQTCPEPRSYLIKTPEGKILRRNRIHLREAPTVDHDHIVPQETCPVYHKRTAQ